jgi:hypothetical protein
VKKQGEETRLRNKVKREYVYIHEVTPYQHTKNNPDMTSQDKARQDKTRQGKTRQGKARQGKAMARQGKGRDKTKYNKTTNLLSSIPTCLPASTCEVTGNLLPNTIHSSTRK